LTSPKLTEHAIQCAVVAHWRALAMPGTLVAAIPNHNAHGQPGLHRGLFDLIVFGPKLPCGFIELKAERGRASVQQLTHRDLLNELKIPNAITYGRDEPIAILEEWGVVRRQT
jgi:hypothetical protein